MGETWRGRYPITSFVQQALLRKSESDDCAVLLDEEQVLLSACTFWSATARGELRGWFRTDADGRVRDAVHALTQIGAVRLAGIVRAHAGVLLRSPGQADIDQLEELLLRSEDHIEELTARYAARLRVCGDGTHAGDETWLA